MESEFITALFPGTQDVKTQSLSNVRDRLHKFIPKGSRARYREIGKEFGRWQNEADLVPKVINRLEKMGVGPRLVVQRESNKETMGIREVTKTPNLGAAPEIEEIHAAVWDAFDVRSGGLWLCRYIDGTRSVSRHGYLSSSWKGAAEDIFPMGKDANAAGLEKVANFIISGTKAGRLKAQNVIWLQRIWEPGVGEHVYGGVTHYHVHADVSGGGPCNP